LAHVFRSVAFRLWALLGAVCFDDLYGEVLEFGEQGAEFLRVIE